MEGAGQRVELAQGGDGLEAGNDGHGDAGLAAGGLETVEGCVVEEHLRDHIVGTGINLALEVFDVGLEVGGFVVFFGIACHADAETMVGGLDLYVGVEVVAVVEVADVGYELVGMCKAVGLGQEGFLSGHGIAAQGHDIVKSQEAQVEELALYLMARGSAADDVGHDVYLGILSHDGRDDGDGGRPAREGEPCEGAVGIGVVLHFVAMAGDVDERRAELHQRLQDAEQTLGIGALQRRNNLERGEGASLALADDVDDFHRLIN